MRTRLAAPALTGLAILAMIALAEGCGETGDGTSRGGVPLPKAWPRTAVYDSVYTAFDGTDLEVNAAAVASAAEGGLTVAYPAYHSSLYISDTCADSDSALKSVEANRLERIDLNIGGRRTEMKEVTMPNGVNLRVFVTPQGSLTPLQFLAVGRHRVLSGALAVDRLPVSADSVRPTLDAVERDVIHLAKQLRP